MTGRRALLVGSLPGADADEAMTDAYGRLGERLATLPDGETGERRNWVISMIEELRRHPDLEEVRSGDWSDYDDIPKLKVRKGHRFEPSSVHLGISEAAQSARPVFDRLRADATSAGHEPPRFQVGIPGDVDLAMFTFGPSGPARHRKVFTKALADTMRRVRVQYGDDVLFQIEVPAEVVLLARTPAPGRPALADVLGRIVAGLAGAAPPGAILGLHLCLGDMNHKAFGRIKDVRPLVQLTNAIARHWPSGRELEYVHLPLAHAEEPPVDRPAFYAPLDGLRLRPGVRVVAGFAHEEQELATQVRIRDVVDAAVGVPVDISTSCGLGRRDPASARAAVDRIRELTDA